MQDLKKENAELKEQCLILADGNVCSSTTDKEIKESRAYAEMSQALSIYHGEQRSIPETDDDAGDEY